ncbi:MAG: MBL fold metallo-hydrolase [Pyrinomonadaceae bacterium]|nr:MBL fold metallo-hydrolase [Pyrinomonadaceae bacterium]
MNVSLKDLPTYSGFARRFARRFIAERVAESHVPIAAAPHRPQPATWGNGDVTIAWLGHATVLINFYGTWLLTDPALRSRVGLRVAGATFGPRRLVHPALALRELPPLDAVLISHAHMDHSDLGTLRRLPRRTRAVVLRGNGDLVGRFACIDELAWGESVDINGARVEAIEVSHWGARMLTDQHRGYGGFLIEKNNRAIVFGGDTAYTRAFAKLRHRARIDLAILPIGAYDPYIHVHANPEQAWAMAREMGADHILPIHHSTFRLSREPAHEPITRLLAAVGERESWRVAATEIGQTWVMPKQMASS